MILSVALGLDSRYVSRGWLEFTARDGGARDHLTAGSAVSARGSLDKAEIALRYSPFSAHAWHVCIANGESAGQRGGLHGGEVRESVTSISEQARKLPMRALRHGSCKARESERLLRRDGSFRPLRRSRAVGRA